MSYEQKVSRSTPGLIVPVIDDSYSMSGQMAGTNDKKYKWVEYDFKAILHELLQRSTESKNGVPVIKPRYYLSIIEYGTKPQFWGDPLMDIETAVRKFTDNGDSMGLGGRLQGTDGKTAQEFAYDHLQKILSDEKFRNSFPPTVFHITDGESATDARAIVEKIKQLATNDGNVLMVNAYIGAQTNLKYKNEADFPGYIDVKEVGPNTDNIRLFEMSSVMPACVEENLKSQGIFPNIRPNSRLFFDIRTRDMLKKVVQVIGSVESRMAR